MAYTTIDDPSAHFQTLLYTGNATGRSLTNTGNSDLQPDLVWVKDRGATNDHKITDSSRLGGGSGPTRTLESNTNAAEYDDQGEGSDATTSFDTDGFTIGTNGNYNTNTNSYVAWQWKANGGTRTTNTESGNNPAGGYQANTTAGFSIVDYTGTGAAGTMAHGLGAVPHCIIFKARAGTENWPVYHIATGNTHACDLNRNVAKIDNATLFNDTTPTSSVFTVNSDSAINADGVNYIAYCFTSIQGYSKFGSFKGTNNADGVFIYTGFKPAFFIWKRHDHSTGWGLIDSTRNPTNQGFYQAFPHDTGEGNYALGDFVSNGIKWRNTFADTNSVNDYLYMAFAESPFVSSEGVPCTAR